MIFKFFDNTQAETDNETGERLIAAIDNGAEWVEIDGDRFNVKSISAIVKSTYGGRLISFSDEKLLTVPTTDLTEEKRLENIKKIRAMKEKFIMARTIREQKLRKQISEKLDEYENQRKDLE